MTIKTIWAGKLRPGAVIRFNKIHVFRYSGLYSVEHSLCIEQPQAGYSNVLTDINKPPYTYYGKGEKTRRVVWHKPAVPSKGKHV